MPGSRLRSASSRCAPPAYVEPRLRSSWSHRAPGSMFVKWRNCRRKAGWSPVSVQAMNRKALVMTVAALTSVFALAADVGAVPAAAAATKPSNIAATQAYLRARHSYEQAIKGDGPADRASADALVAEVTAKCPNVLAGATPAKATEEITREADSELDRALESAQRGPSIAFAHKIERLRWSNRKLTYYVRGFAAETRAEAELVAPDLCTDARAVAASHYQAVPASTTQYARATVCAYSKVLIENRPDKTGELDEIIAIMLRPYERPSERPLIPRILNKRERQSRARSDSQRSAAAESELTGALGLPKGEPPQPLGLEAPTCLSPPPR